MQNCEHMFNSFRAFCLKQSKYKYTDLQLSKKYASTKANNSSKLSRITAAAAASTIAVATGIYLIYHHRKSYSNETTKGFNTIKYTKEQVNSKLHALEKTIPLPYQPLVQQIDVSQLPSNNPCEDRYSHHALSDGTGFLFGVYDGHAGWQCSDMLSRRLPAYVAKKIEESHMSGGLKLVSQGESEGKKVIEKILEESFLNLDDEIVNGCVGSLNINEKRLEISENQYIRSQLLPAMAGSCVLLAYVNTINNTVSVACVGDSRSIIGRCKTDTENNKWEAIRMSEDQTGRNQSEVLRMRNEHPGEEETVIYRGRVLGGLGIATAYYYIN